MAEVINGQCLCGKVRVTATRAAPVLRACHCDMCRRHTSAMFMSIPTVPESDTVTGPAQTYRSSDWAERGFCGFCGSTLWYGTLAEGARNYAAGLFPDVGGAVLDVEYFHDAKPAGYALAGTHRKLTGAETVALFTGGRI